MTIRQRLERGKKLFQTQYWNRYLEEDYYFIEDYSVDIDVVLYVKAREEFGPNRKGHEPLISDLEEIIVDSYLDRA